MCVCVCVEVEGDVDPFESLLGDDPSGGEGRGRVIVSLLMRRTLRKWKIWACPTIVQWRGSPCCFHPSRMTQPEDRQWPSKSVSRVGGVWGGCGR